jgi:type I restriction enzyme, R subunit
VYGRAKVAWQEHCSIGELLSPPPKESAHLEYKSTFRTRAVTRVLFKLLQTASLKTIAAFLNNREGWTVFIGLAEDRTVFGLESDYATLRKPGKDDRDLFLLHFQQALLNAVGMAAAANASMCDGRLPEGR